MCAQSADSLRILVTDAQTRAALGAVRSLGRAGHTVIAGYPAGSGRPPSVSSRYCSEHLRYPDPYRHQSLFKEWLCDQASRRTVDAILPVAEASLRGAAAIRKELPIDVLLIAPSDAALHYTLSKFHSTRLALDLGMPCPTTVFISEGSGPRNCRDELSTLRFPIIIKSDNYFTSEGGYVPGQHFIVRDIDGARRVLDNLAHLQTRIIAQEVVPGTGTGAFLLRFQGRRHLSFVHRRLHEVPYTGGVSSFRESCRDDELVNLGERLLDAIDYEGIAMIEFRRAATDGRPYFLEINGRLWGSLALALHCGVDFPAALVRCYQIGSPAFLRPGYRSGLRCRNVFPGEVGHLVSILKATRNSDGDKSPPPRLQALARFLALFFDPRIRHDYFWWSDPLPGIHQAWALISKVSQTLFREGYRRLPDYRGNRLVERLRKKHEARRRGTRYFERPLRRILFVCLGNICRSPFASVYWNTRLRNLSSTLPEAVSAGFYPVPNRRTPDLLTEVASEFKVELRDHRSRVVCRDEVEAVDAIFVMDRENYRRLIDQFPSVNSKTYLLGLFAGDGRSEIADPYSKGKASAHACCEQLVSSLECLMKQVLRG